MATARHRLMQWMIRAAESISARRELKAAPLRAADVAIVTAYTPEISEMGKIAVANRRSYTDRHGYRLLVRTDGFDRTRPPAWSKIRFIDAALRTNRCVLWSDADALIMNPTVEIRSLLPPETDIVLTEALAPFRHINTGHMLFRSSAFSRLFLAFAWRLTAFIHDPSWEQRAINHLVATYRFRRLKVVPNRQFNSYGHVPDDPDPYRPGDFVIHFPGVAEKAGLMRRYAALAS